MACTGAKWWTKSKGKRGERERDREKMRFCEPRRKNLKHIHNTKQQQWTSIRMYVGCSVITHTMVTTKPKAVNTWKKEKEEKREREWKNYGDDARGRENIRFTLMNDLIWTLTSTTNNYRWKTTTAKVIQITYNAASLRYRIENKPSASPSQFTLEYMLRYPLLPKKERKKSSRGKTKHKKIHKHINWSIHTYRTHDIRY